MTHEEKRNKAWLLHKQANIEDGGLSASEVFAAKIDFNAGYDAATEAMQAEIARLREAMQKAYDFLNRKHVMDASAKITLEKALAE